MTPAAEALVDAQRRLAALQDQVRIAEAHGFASFTPPTFPLEELSEVLQASIDDIDATAMAAVQAHLQRLGASGESWLRQGRHLQDRSAGHCPYCAQDLIGSALVGHYGAYFGEAYSDFVETVSQFAGIIRERFDGDSLAGYLRTVEDQRAAHGLWSQYLELAPFDIDPEGLAALWQGARDAVLELVQAKMADPLTRLEVDPETSTAVSDYNRAADAFRRVSQDLMAVLGVVSEMEKSQIRERQLEGIALAKARGAYVGRRPGSVEGRAKFLRKPRIRQIADYLDRGYKGVEIRKIVGCSPNTISKVKRLTMK